MLKRALFPTLLGVALYYAVFGGEYSALDVRSVHIETSEARIVLEELREETESLRARAEALESDARTLETLARERFGMIREGEVLYRFADGGEEEGEEP